MKIKELLYQAPEMTEEKLLSLIKKYSNNLDKYLIKRIESLHKIPLNEGILKEWDLIQEKKSYLTKGERDKVNGIVSFCLVQMVKTNESVKEENT